MTTTSRRIVVERALYFGLFVLLFASLALFLLHYSLANLWEIYSRAYFLLLLIYTWFIFILLFIGDKKPAKPSSKQPFKLAVIVPCYNEEPELLYKAIKSVMNAKGEKSIYVVDDGSTKKPTVDILQQLREVQDRFNVKVHFFEANQGKRQALHHAVKHMIDDVDLVVTIDSDTVLDKNALLRISEPFVDTRIGATTGDVLLLNEKQNLITRMQGAYYWIGLNIYKRAQSAIGIVVCCSGCLSCYRADALKGLIDNFASQKFFGEQCTHSEDRHLTNLILRQGYRVHFVPEAICYTEAPSTVRGFLKQQQRWKRGYIRESIFTLTYAWKTRPVLFLEILFWELTIPFFSLGLMLALVVTIFTDPLFFLTAILPAWIIFACVRYVHIFFYGKRKIPGLLIYMIFYDIFLYWQSIYALFTVRNKGWITR